MADPVAPETPETPETKPVMVNPDALQAQIAAGVKSAMSELQAQTRQGVQAAQQDLRAQQVQQQWAADPVAQTIAPYVAPIVQNLGLQIQAANDKGDFYAMHPEATKYRGDIESMFNQLMTQGRPMEREAVWYYYKGRNAEAFAEEAAKSQKDQVAQSNAANAVVGGGAGIRPDGVDMNTFRTLPVEKQREALQGMVF